METDAGSVTKKKWKAASVPILFPWVEERIELSVENSRQVRPFGPIALRTGQAQGFRIVGAAMLLGDDVLDVEQQEIGVVFVKVAVFTPMACALPNEGPQNGIHHSPGVPARSWRALDLRMAT